MCCHSLTPSGPLPCARLSMTPEEHRAFWRNVQFTVDKDVVRTDRSNQFFRGEGNPNVETMRYCPPPPLATPGEWAAGLLRGPAFLQVPTVTPGAEDP